MQTDDKGLESSCTLLSVGTHDLEASFLNTLVGKVEVPTTWEVDTNSQVISQITAATRKPFAIRSEQNLTFLPCFKGPEMMGGGFLVKIKLLTLSLYTTEVCLIWQLPGLPIKNK